MDRQELKQLLNILYEMEGLTDMAIRRDEETPEGIFRLIAQKAQCVSEITSSWSVADDGEADLGCADYSINEAEEPTDELETSALESHLDESEALIEEPQKEESETLESPLFVGVNDAEPDDDIDVEFVYGDDEDAAEDESAEQLSPEQPQEDEQESDEESMIDSQMSTLFDASAFDDDDEDDEEDEGSEEDVCYDATDDEEVLDEEPSEEDGDFLASYTDASHSVDVSDRPDIRRMFSVNDRYRFRRELFSNSEVDFVDNLNLVQAMSCYEDAEDYFYNDLQWDKEFEEVVEFMSIIYRYFNSTR